MISEQSQFATSHTPLAAYLVSVGFILLSIAWRTLPDGKRQALFLFSDSTELQNHVTSFESGTAIINVAAYDKVKSGLLDKVKGR